MARDEATTAEKVDATGVPTATTVPQRRGFPAGGVRAWRWPLMIGGPLLMLLIAAYFILTGGRTQATDDAYVQAARVPVSASIGGRVIELDVHENQPVKAGQVLFKLDTRDFDATQAQAAAQFAAAKLQVQALQADYQQQLAALKMAQRHRGVRPARRGAAEGADAGRRRLARPVRDRRSTTPQLAQQNVATAQQQVAQALANLGGANMTVANHPQRAAGRRRR